MPHGPCRAGLCCHLWVSGRSAVPGAPASSLKPEGRVLALKYGRMVRLSIPHLWA